MNTKYCKYCGETKDITSFYKNSKMANGYLNRCKECYAIFQKQRYSGTLPCEGSAEGQRERSLNYYYANQQKKQEEARLRYHRNKYNPKYILIKSRYKKRRYESIKNTSNPATVEQINKLIKDSNGVCFWCDEKIQDGNLQLDHIYPLSKNGKHEINNLVVSCLSCNVRKNAKDPEQWLDEILVLWK